MGHRQQLGYNTTIEARYAGRPPIIVLQLRCCCCAVCGSCCCCRSMLYDVHTASLLFLGCCTVIILCCCCCTVLLYCTTYRCIGEPQISPVTWLSFERLSAVAHAILASIGCWAYPPALKTPQLPLRWLKIDFSGSRKPEDCQRQVLRSSPPR